MRGHPVLTSHRRRAHGDAAADARALAQLAEGGDPALRRVLETRASAGYSASRGFRKAWDRLMVAFFIGR